MRSLLIGIFLHAIAASSAMASDTLTTIHFSDRKNSKLYDFKSTNYQGTECSVPIDTVGKSVVHISVSITAQWRSANSHAVAFIRREDGTILNRFFLQAGSEIAPSTFVASGSASAVDRPQVGRHYYFVDNGGGADPFINPGECQISVTEMRP